MLYDFYYSEEQSKRIYDSAIRLCEIPTKNFINGKEYTEAIKHGEEPLSKNFSDLKKVSTEEMDYSKIETKKWWD